MSLIVQKFGGTSVADDKCLLNVANIITSTYNEGNNVVVVVSAQGDTTNKLIEKALKLNENPSKREMDMLLSSGEQISSALLAITIEKLGYPVVSLTGWQAGFNTNSNYTNARINKINSERLKKEISERKIVIVAGFQGINMFVDITTLGRGGSDTTAVALAVELKADLCQIYTDVDGVYTTDPRLLNTAKKLDEISYEEMLELASLGAKVLHSRSVELAQKYNVQLEVLSSTKKCSGTIVREGNELEKMLVNLGAKVLHSRSVELAQKYNVQLEVLSSTKKCSGTIVREGNELEKMLVKGVTVTDDVARITIMGLPNNSEITFKIFSYLSQKDISVDIIIQSIDSENKKNISFTVPLEQKDLSYNVIKEQLNRFNADGIEVDDNVSKLSIIGCGMRSNPGVASKMFEALHDSGINTSMISTSEIKVSVLIPREDSKKALKVVHDAFII